MTTLREAATQALEAMDKATRYMSDSDYRKLNDAITALKAALEQPEQEPVAWCDIEEDGTIHGLRYWSEQGCREHALYTNPPRREWRGMTDAELREAYLSVSGNEWCLGGMANAESFYEAIEAKLKELNA